MQGDVVVRSDAALEASLDELRVRRAPAFLPVVVRARAAGQKAQTVHRGQFRTERVGDAVLEPADHPGTPASQQNSLLPGLAQDLVEAVDAPDRECLRAG